MGKENLFKGMWNKSKNYIVGLFIAASPATASANTSFRAFPGETYNTECNGSICWLSSASRETYGSKHSIAEVSGDGYRGINQMSTHHTKQFVKYIGKCKDMGIEEFAKTFDLQNLSKEQINQIQQESSVIYTQLSNKGTGKKNWQEVALNHEHVLTMLNQGYLTQEYSPENFAWIQNKLNKDKIDFDLSKVHPAILSEIHLLTIARPAWRSNITTKIENTIKGKEDPYAAVNSEEFITEIAQLEKVKDVRNRVITYTSDALKSKEIQWKEAEVISLLANANATNSNGQTWFDQRRDQQRLETALEINTDSLKIGISGEYNIQTPQIDLAQIQSQINKISAPLKEKHHSHRRNQEQLTLAKAKEAKQRARDALKKDEELLAIKKEKDTPQIGGNPPTEEELIAMVQNSLETQNDKPLKGRKAKQAERNLERFNTDENYRNAVVQAYISRLSQQNKA